MSDLAKFRADLSDAKPVDELLKRLRELATLDVTLEQLIESKVGRAVRKLQKHSDADVGDACRALLQRWAKLVPAGKTVDAVPSDAATTPAKPTKSAEAKRDAAASAATPDADAKAGEKRKRAPAGGAAKKAAAAATAAAAAAALPDLRQRAVTLLAEAVAQPAAAAGDAAGDAGDADELEAAAFEAEPETVALAIEAALFGKHAGDVGKAYKTQLRSLTFNLKNKKNPGLRQSVMLGEIGAAELVGMSVHDLADPELAEQRRRDAEWAQKVAMGPELAAPTSAFTCRKCKKSECRYIQLQTRSADEPMTIFISCVNCGNKWRA